MSGDDYLPSPVTSQAILETLQAAFIEARIDKDGDVIVDGPPHTFVMVSGRDIRLMAGFALQPGKTRMAQLEFVNRVNDDLKIPRLSLHSYSDASQSFIFDWYIPAVAPVSKKEFVTALRRFLDNFSLIGDKDVDNVLA